MSPAWIRPRTNGDGSKSFQVLYRNRGGRNAPVRSAGTFRGWPSGKRGGHDVAALSAARDEARTRRDLVAGWLAAGLNPAEELARLEEHATAPRNFSEVAEAMIATRHDASAQTIRGKRKAIDKVTALRPDLAAKPPERWTVGDVQELVAAMVKAGLAPSTIDKYLTDGPKLVLDFADVHPNPARDERVKLPSRVAAEVQPPTSKEVLAILGRVARRHLLPLIVLEQTAMRVGELASLPWGDVDVAGCRFRLSRTRTKTRHPRWVQLPAWLMEQVDALCPLEDRTETRSVFTTTDSALRQAMTRACRIAKIPVYSPHDLRHRRASLWHGQGLTVRELMERGGWKRSEIAIDLYSHVMPLDEIAPGRFEELLRAC